MNGVIKRITSLEGNSIFF